MHFSLKKAYILYNCGKHTTKNENTMQIKANTIQHLTDARYFAAKGSDWLGVDLNMGSPTAIPPKTIQDIRGWLSGPKFVGEFSAMQSAAFIAGSVELLALDAVQIDSFIDLEQVYNAVDVPVIQTWKLEAGEDLEALWQVFEANSPKVAAFLLGYNGDWKALQQDAPTLTFIQKACTQFPIWLSILFESQELPNLLQQLPIHCLCIDGGAEERVGCKSFDELEEVFEWLEEES